MEKLTTLKAVAAPIYGTGVNTDQIFPARFLKKPRDVGYAQFAFHDIRRDKDGEMSDDFALNTERFKEAKILVAGTNFGIGSSREGAVYTLLDSGYRVLIAPSFGDIFAANCLKNGLLTVRLEAGVVEDIQRQLEEGDSTEIAVDLPEQSLTTPGGDKLSFEVEEFQKYCLLNGLNEIDISLEFVDEMDVFEAKHRERMPWLKMA